MQETWLAQDELILLKNLHIDFNADGVSSLCDDGFHVGRPHGGIAILWRKQLAKAIKVKSYDDKRLMGVEFSNGNQTFLLLNVYLPHDNRSYSREQYEDLMYYLGKILAIIHECNTSNVYIMGDWNAGISQSSVFGKELFAFCEENNLIVTDVALLGKESGQFTFYSEAHSTTSWIDHCVSTFNAHKHVDEVEIFYEYLSSDHFPMQITVSIRDNFEANMAHNDDIQPVKRPVTCWSKASDNDIMNYQNGCNALLSNIYIPTEALACSDCMCTLNNHKADIDKFYNDIVTSLNLSALQHIPSSNGKKQSSVPGWNEYVKDFHEKARLSFLLWTSIGKPRHGIIHQQMLKERAQFKYALRACRKEETVNKANGLANDLLNKDQKKFWSDVKNQSCKSVPLADMIDGKHGHKDIADMWAVHFKSLFNSVKSEHFKESVLANINDISDVDFNNLCFKCDDTADILSKLDKGKACGLDGLFSEHLIYGGWRLSVLLTLCFNACLSHGYMPPNLTKTVIVPVIKEKTGDSSDKGNYRPIALTSIVSKVFEIALLYKIEFYLETTDYQFGFKAKHSTDMCIYALKEVISYYRKHSSPVFVCFMDASKAFDKINHWTLFKKLCDRGVPSLIIRLLLVWYRTQTICIRWGSYVSEDFFVTNGVRQGGILSPRLFNVYIDELSVSLSSSHAGCVIGSKMINHFAYADDLVLLCPSAKGLQKLLKICEQYGNVHDITYNCIKTVCMTIVPKGINFSSNPKLILSDRVLSFVTCYKYLGVFIQNNLTDDKDISRQLRAFYAKSNFLMRNFSMCTQEVKSKLFSAFCSNMYCGHLWSTFTRSTLSKVMVAYNNSYRRLMGLQRSCSASGMFVFNKVHSFGEIRRKSIFQFRQRILASSNHIISCIYDCAFYNSTSTWRKWDTVLYSL